MKITSDHCGFAEVRPSKKSSTPTSKRWSELSFLCGFLPPVRAGFAAQFHYQSQLSTDFDVHIFPQALGDFDKEIQ